MAGTSKSDTPATWQDALSQAQQAIASGLNAPDADVQFGLALMGAMAEHGKKHSGTAGAGGPAGAPGAGGAGSPPPGAPPSPSADPSSPPSGLDMGSAGAGSGAGTQPNSQMMNQAAPQGPRPGGMSQGITPNPDELRRVLADVAGK